MTLPTPILATRSAERLPRSIFVEPALHVLKFRLTTVTIFDKATVTGRSHMARPVMLLMIRRKEGDRIMSVSTTTATNAEHAV